MNHDKRRTAGKTAVIIGAGAAGLTAASELLERTDIVPVVVEQSDILGGIAQTRSYKGNRMDIGGHRFFSKSDRVMQWWLKVLPLQKLEHNSRQITYRQKIRQIESSSETGPDPDKTDEVMLVRRRKSRVYFMRKFFDYPIRLSTDTLSKLGLFRTFRIGLSYLHSVFFPIRNEENLEEFLHRHMRKKNALLMFLMLKLTQKKSGVCPAGQSAPSGEHKGSRAYLLPKPSAIFSTACSPSPGISPRKKRKPLSLSNSSIPSWARARCGKQ